MYMPIDPKEMEGMWEKLKNSLTSQKSCLVVSNGSIGKSLTEKVLTEVEAEDLLTRFKQYDYVRVGSNKMTPMPAHYAIDISEGKGILKEYVALTPDNLKNDVTLITQFAFYENKELIKLLIPFLVDCEDDPELTFKQNSQLNETIVSRR